ncbi:MAG TPA: hypothetical protein VF980_06180 [Thermoanaerobaculia bacterium]
MTRPGSVTIERGEILVYRLLDVADQVDLALVESLLRERPGSSRLQLRPRGEAFVVKNAPLLVPLGRDDVEIAGRRFAAETFARVWDYGVVSINFRIALDPSSEWQQLVALAAAVEATHVFHDIARRRSGELVDRLAPAFRGVHEWDQIEDYTIFFLERIAGIERAFDLIDRVDVPALILAEADDPLAEAQRKPVLESTRQYSTADLAVIDWNSALVVEPSGIRDVPDVIEIALTQLMEFRYYDELLDDKLGVLYRAVGQRRTSLLRTDYRRLSREASALYMEISEFVERIENSLKFVGDFYLATIFRTAVSRFRLTEWEENVTRKMEVVARVAEMLNAEVNARRSEVLEIVVVLLIVFEIVWAVVGYR